MQDKFVRGFIAGIFSGVIINAWSFTAGAIGITNLRTADLVGVLIYAKAPPFATHEVLFALAGHLLVTGIIGIVFAYVISRLKSSHILFKGFIFSICVWYTVYVATTFFQVPGTIPTPFGQVVTSTISATIYGLLLAYSYSWLSKKTNSNT